MAPGPTAQVVPARAGSAPASTPLNRLLASRQVPHWNTHPVPASTWGTASVSGAEQEAGRHPTPAVSNSHCQAAVLCSPQLHSHVGTAQTGTPAQPSWGRMGIQHSWWGQEAVLLPRWLFLNPKPSPVLSFPCPLPHVLGLTDTVAPPWPPRASSPAPCPDWERGPSMNPAPCESQSPGSSHRQDPAAQAVPELEGLGCKGCRNRRTSHPPPSQPAPKQSV